MKVLFSENLIKSIPKEKYEVVLQDIKDFCTEYQESNFNIRDMKLGWSVRKVEGTKNIKEIYKFRVNRADRVLFTYGKNIHLRDSFFNSPWDKSSSNPIVFLEFCNHDEQITRARNITGGVVQESQLDELDYEIEQKYKEYSYDIDKSISRIINLDEMDALIDNNCERVIYYLNKEQFDLIIKDIKPLFVFGSAGSGKTTISVNKAYILASGGYRVKYFTYSSNLVKEAKKVFEKVCNYDECIIDEEYISFNELNDFLTRVTKKSSFVNYHQFEEWFNKLLNYKSVNLDVSEIYREIRGVIKGLVPIDWIEIKLLASDLSNGFVDFLIDNKYAYMSGEHIFVISNNLAEINTKNKLFQGLYNSDVNKLYEIIDDYIINNNIMSKELYLSLPEEYSLFDLEQKNIIYDIADKYQQYLKSNNKADENDMTRIALRKIIESKEEKYDYIICDEVQDLTELQIYLITKLVNDNENILFSGDFNQTINPTFFHTGRIEALYKIYNGMFRFEISTMSNNYRSSKNIISFVNKLNELKIKTLGRSKRNDYDEISMRNTNGNVRIFKNNITEKELFSITKDRAYVDIIIANDVEKSKFFNAKDYSQLFTLSEYKGLENDYIIGYNIISSFRDKWQVILDNKAINASEYRYYFNLLYVFLTRARNNILLVEDDINEDFLNYFRSYVEVVDKFDYRMLNLERKSTKDEFYKRAKKFELNKNYSEAIDMYKKSNLSEKELENVIKRCMALEKILKGQYKSGADELFEIGEYESAVNAYLKCEDYLKTVECCVYSNKTYVQIKDILPEERYDIFDYIENNSKEISWYEKFKYMYQAYLNEQLSLLKSDVISIIETIKNINEEGV